MNYKEQVRNIVGAIVARKGIFGQNPASPEVERARTLNYLKEVFWEAKKHSQLMCERLRTFEGVQNPDEEAIYQKRIVSNLREILRQTHAHYKNNPGLFNVRESRTGKEISERYEMNYLM